MEKFKSGSYGARCVPQVYTVRNWGNPQTINGPKRLMNWEKNLKEVFGAEIVETSALSAEDWELCADFYEHFEEEALEGIETPEELLERAENAVFAFCIGKTEEERLENLGRYILEETDEIELKFGDVASDLKKLLDPAKVGDKWSEDFEDSTLAWYWKEWYWKE